METSYLVYALRKKYKKEYEVFSGDGYCERNISKNYNVFRYKIKYIIGIFTLPKLPDFRFAIDHLYVFEKIIPNTTSANKDVFIYDPKRNQTATGKLDMSDWLLFVDYYNDRHLFDRISGLVMKEGLPL